MKSFKKSAEEIEMEILTDAATLTPSSRQHAQAEIAREVQEFLRNGGRIKAVTGSTCTSGTFNTPISERSGRILEGFNNRKTKKSKKLKVQK